jgi:hypothetical protein
MSKNRNLADLEYRVAGLENKPSIQSLYIGEIRMFAPSVALPAGWQVCNGTNGTVDLRDRFVVAQGATFPLGSVGGSFTITAANMPSHSHGGAVAGTDTNHTHDLGAQQATLSGGTTGAAGAHSHVQQGVPHQSTPDGQVIVAAGYGYPAQSLGYSTQDAGHHTHEISGLVTISGSTGTVSASPSHAHAIAAEGGGAAYYQPYYALIFAQYVGA